MASVVAYLVVLVVSISGLVWGVRSSRRSGQELHTCVKEMVEEAKTGADRSK